MLSFFRKIGPGLLLCLVLAVPAWFLGQAFPVIGGPVFAILLGNLVGMVLNRKAGPCPSLQPGITFTSKKILQYAVVLLGFGLNLSQIAQVGVTSLPIIASTITHVADYRVCAVPALENPQKQRHAGGRGVVHLRRVGHCRHRPR